MSATYHLRKAQQVMARGVRPHYVYFIVAAPRSAGERLVKIGTTTDVDRRLSEIRKGGAKTPDELSADTHTLHLAGWTVADGETEKHLHRAFAQHRRGGEWFALDPIREDINQLLAHHCQCRGCQIDGGTSAHL